MKPALEWLQQEFKYDLNNNFTTVGLLLHALSCVSLATRINTAHCNKDRILTRFRLLRLFFDVAPNKLLRPESEKVGEPRNQVLEEGFESEEV